MTWNTIVSSGECRDHPDYRKDWKEHCTLTMDGKCTFENCPHKDPQHGIFGTCHFCHVVSYDIQECWKCGKPACSHHRRPIPNHGNLWVCEDCYWVYY